jgi:hypothetical protein
MTDLFSHASARAGKEEGMARAEANANPDWKAFMLEQVRLVCMEQPRFTSDDVFARAAESSDAPSTHEGRAFGPVMMRAAKLGYCRPTNLTMRSSRASNHSRPIAVWESRIYQ